jgi:hypothetical protein
MVTNNTPGTMVYKTTNPHPVCDIPSFMKWVGAKPDTQIGDVLKTDMDLGVLLKKNGLVLDGLTAETLVSNRKFRTKRLPQGTTLSIPGSVVPVP